MDVYRIAEQGDGRFVVQWQARLFFVFPVWCDMFCGAVSDLPDTFATFDEAKAKLQKYLDDSIPPVPKSKRRVHEYVVFASNPTVLADWDTSKAMGPF